MKRINSIVKLGFLMFLIPIAMVSGQEKKNEQKIKIVVKEDGGSNVVLDTLITGNSANDSIILKNGKTIYLSREESENPGDQVTKKIIITSPDGVDTKKEVRKEITIISSNADSMGDSGKEKCKQAKCEKMISSKYAYTVDSDKNEGNSEQAKYVISRDGVVITVEGSDYAKVKETIKDIEKTLDKKSEVK